MADVRATEHEAAVETSRVLLEYVKPEVTFVSVVVGTS